MRNLVPEHAHLPDVAQHRREEQAQDMTSLPADDRRPEVESAAFEFRQSLSPKLRADVIDPRVRAITIKTP